MEGAADGSLDVAAGGSGAGAGARSHAHTEARATSARTRERIMGPTYTRRDVMHPTRPSNVVPSKARERRETDMATRHRATCAPMWASSDYSHLRRLKTSQVDPRWIARPRDHSCGGVSRTAGAASTGLGS
jgi:hypothetical protein